MMEVPRIPNENFALMEALQEVAERQASARTFVGPHQSDFTDECWAKMQAGRRTAAGIERLLDQQGFVKR